MGTRSSLIHAFGEDGYRQAHLSGMNVGILDLTPDQAFSWRGMMASHEYIELGFCLAGGIECTVGGERRVYDAVTNQSYIGHQPGDLEFCLCVDSQPVRLVLIQFKPELVHRLAEREPYRLLADLLTTSENRVYMRPATLTATMRSLAEQMFARWPHQSQLQSLALRLAEAQIALMSGGRTHSQVVLSPDDIERVHHARALLLNDLQEPPTMEQLAHATALNEFKLKLGFRQAFGTTVFGCLREARMQRALAMLREEKHNVTRVALDVGYANPSMFARAFQRRFGMLPSRCCEHPV